jgi:hypothetical protein
MWVKDAAFPGPALARASQPDAQVTMSVPPSKPGGRAVTVLAAAGPAAALITAAAAPAITVILPNLRM